MALCLFLLKIKAKINIMTNKTLTIIALLITASIPVPSLLAETSNQAATAKNIIIVEKQRLQKINQEQQKLSQVKPRIPSKTLRLKVSTNKLHYKIGDAIIISITPTEDAYITVINHGTSGDVHQLFPNKYNQQRFVKANQTIRIPKNDAPYNFIVTEPVGSDFIKVIASTDAGKILADSSLKPLIKGGVFKQIKKPAGALSKDLNITLSKKQHAGKSVAYNHKIYISK